MQGMVQVRGICLMCVFCVCKSIIVTCSHGMHACIALHFAGERLLEAGMTKGLCLDHEPGNTVLIDRCNGFAQAIADKSNAAEYLGKVDVPLDNAAQYKAVIEEAAGDTIDDDGFALFLLGPAQTEEALAVQEAHRNIIMGSVDTNEEMYTAISQGKIQFGIQQGPYMQGYMPIPMLTWLSYTSQTLQNLIIESGPSFVEEAPGEALQTCETNMFKTCQLAKDATSPGSSQTTASSTGQPNLVAIVVPSTLR